MQNNTVSIWFAYNANHGKGCNSAGQTFPFIETDMCAPVSLRRSKIDCHGASSATKRNLHKISNSLSFLQGVCILVSSAKTATKDDTATSVDAEVVSIDQRPLWPVFTLCSNSTHLPAAIRASRGFHPHNCWNKSSTHSNPGSWVNPTKRASLFVRMFRRNAFGLYLGLPWPSFACDRFNDHDFHTHFCRASSQVQFVLHPPSTLQWEISVESPMHSWRCRHGRHSFKHWKRENYVKLLQPSARHLTNGKDQVVQR